MARPQFILIAGPNGAGKSTYTKHMKRHLPSIEVIDPDAIARDMTGSYSTVDQEQMAAGKKAISLVRSYIDGGRPFLVESTISGRSYLRYAQVATEAGFRTIFIYIALRSPELSAQRVAQRVRSGGHNIPVEDIKRRYPKSIANIKDHVKAFENAYLYDNSDSYSWVASYRHGSLYRSSSIPDWLARQLP